MKIVFVIRHFYPFTRPSGPTSFIRELSNELVKHDDVDLAIMCLKKEGEKPYYNHNEIPVYKFNSLGFFGYRKTIKSLNPDYVVHISSISSGSILFIWWLLLLINTRNTKTIFFQLTNFHLLKFLPTAKLLLSQYDAHLVTSGFLEKFYEKSFNLIPEKIFPGVDHKKLTTYKKRRRETIQKICFFGHVSHVKGIDLFIELSRDCKDLKFHVVAGHGSGDNRDKKLMQEVVESCKQLDNLEYTGNVDDPFALMARCDLLVLPYRTGGSVLGVAQSAIEAMAMGIPVIGTKNSALEEIIVNGFNGYFIRDVNEIKLRLQQIENDPDLYLKLSDNAIKTAESTYSIEESAQTMLRVLR